MQHKENVSSTMELRHSVCVRCEKCIITFGIHTISEIPHDSHHGLSLDGLIAHLGEMMWVLLVAETALHVSV